MMSENLGDMIKNAEDPQQSTFQETDLNIPQGDDEPVLDENVSASEGVEEAKEEETEETPLKVLTSKVTNLYDWYSENNEKFEDIRQIKIGATNVKPEKYLVLTVSDLSGEKNADGELYRELRKYDDANVHPVLDLPGYDMKAYPSGFVIYYDLGNNNVVKAYGVRTGLIIVACYRLGDGTLIPHAIGRVRRKDTEINIPLTDGVGFDEKLIPELDKESLQLRYKQSSKIIDELTTVGDAIKWLLERQDDMFDINHLFQIDNVIIDTLAE